MKAELLKWWFTLATIGATLGASFALGWAQWAIKADVTFLAEATVVLMLGFTVFIGVLTHRAMGCGPLRNVTLHQHAMEFAAEFMMVLGIIGTATSMLMMLHGFASSVTPEEVMASVRVDLSSLGLTTVVGLACYAILKIQLVNLQYALDR